MQHQNLLERKLTDQLEDIARRRAELDELERSSIEEMLATDNAQRIEVGSTLESFLVGSQQVSDPCTCSHTPIFDGVEADSKAEENIESSWTGMSLYALSFHFTSCLCLNLFLTLPLEREMKLPAGTSEAQAYDQNPLGEENPHQSEYSEKDNQPPCHENIFGSVPEPDVSELILPTLRSNKQRKGKKKTVPWNIPVAEEASFYGDEFFPPYSKKRLPPQ